MRRVIFERKVPTGQKSLKPVPLQIVNCSRDWRSSPDKRSVSQQNIVGGAKSVLDRALANCDLIDGYLNPGQKQMDLRRGNVKALSITHPRCCLRARTYQGLGFDTAYAIRNDGNAIVRRRTVLFSTFACGPKSSTESVTWLVSPRLTSPPSNIKTDFVNSLPI